MVSTNRNSGRSTASSVTMRRSFSLPGGNSATRPRPSEVRARAVSVKGDKLAVELVDGRLIAVPLSDFPRLVAATSKQRKNYRLVGRGALIHWPDIDEDVDVPNLLRY